MSTRWDNLCAYCPGSNGCENNYGDPCHYESWREARDDIVSNLAGLQEEDDDDD